MLGSIFQALYFDTSSGSCSRWCHKRLFLNLSGEGQTIIFMESNLPISWMALQSSDCTECTASIIQAVNGMLLDMLAVVASKDYEVRRRRQYTKYLKSASGRKVCWAQT